MWNLFISNHDASVCALGAERSLRRSLHYQYLNSERFYHRCRPEPGACVQLIDMRMIWVTAQTQG